MKRAPTLKDIARRLEVAPSTVTRALAEDPRISAGMREKVREAAETLGYVPHSGARSVRNGRSTLLGLIVPDVQNRFFGTVAKSLAERFDAAGYQLILSITNDDPASEERQLQGLLEARVSGIVVVLTAVPTERTLRMLSRARNVVQLIRNHEALGFPWFGIDEATAVRRAVRELVAMGHRRIGYVDSSLQVSTNIARHAGYLSELEASGIAYDPALVRLGLPSVEHGFDAFDSLWRSGARPTGVIAGGPRITLGVLDAVEALGLSVPEEVSIIGYGDRSWVPRKLTTIVLPVEEVALSCGDYLLNLIEHGQESLPDASVESRSVTHEASIWAGRTTAPPSGV